MKNKLIILIITALAIVLAGCGTSTSKNSEENKDSKPKTITYQSETGPVKVPANPKRIVVLSGFAGNVLAFDKNVVGVDAWSKKNPRFKELLKDTKEVSEDNLEGIIALKPDLIIALNTVKDKEKLEKIAPTVLYTYGKVPYLEQTLEIGKAINQEKEVAAWIKDFKARTKVSGDKIKAHIGKDATISILEKYNKQIYVYGDNWGRGSEIIYQEMGLNMPESVKKTALKDGYYAVSPEEIGKFMGDYVILSTSKGADNSFEKTATFKEIPAVKNNHIIEVQLESFYFNDPLTLDFQLKTITDGLLKMK